jgi:hypothetical protein
MKILMNGNFINVLISLSEIRKVRRNVFYEDIFQRPLSTFGFTINFILELGTSRSNLGATKNLSIPNCSRGWIKAITGHAKLNIYALSRNKKVRERLPSLFEMVRKFLLVF